MANDTLGTSGMEIGMTLPIMEPGITMARLREWSELIDAAGFSSLCFGERMAFDNPDALTLLGAVAAWTSRVEVMTTVIVPQLHDPVMLAKALSTGDVLTKGRLTGGLGVGGRHEDYDAVAAPRSTQTMAEMAARALAMKRVWAGEKLTESVLPVGPRPVQPGGPPLLVGTLGPRTMRSAVAWADGLAGVSMDLDLDGIARLFDVARDAWSDAGRGAPRLATSTWFALDDGDGSAREQVHRHLLHYMNWLPVSLVDPLARVSGFAGTPGQLRDLLKRIEDLGADDVHLIPTGSDVAQVERVAELLA
jgi:alkanesulfonate monooxygenase SsuD/methylene tetrahydromethanopterin reductase-like flavin-dependent oxidoreductase (luciferase family)